MNVNASTLNFQFNACGVPAINHSIADGRQRFPLPA